MTPPSLRINATRLWASLLHSATIGATPDGGLCRLALSPPDLEIRAWFATACQQAGGTVEMDALATQWASFPGADPTLPPIAIGSHLDTQPTGGRFDGILGVLAGLELIRTLNDTKTRTRHPLRLVNWTNEEGARFPPAMVASGVWSGAIALAHALAQTDADGITLDQALQQGGANPKTRFIHQNLAAYFELHIEQGPILEAANQQIGIVTGVQGMAWFDVTVEGRPAHAGTTPMHLRADPLAAAAAMAIGINQFPNADPQALTTIGIFQAYPGARNTIPARVQFSVDLRHPTPDGLAALEARLTAALPPQAAQAGCTVTIEPIWRSAPVNFDPAVISAIQTAASQLGLRHCNIVSGAGHDAVYTARTTPTAMIFTPCQGGISHHPAESITPEQAEHGANVLLNAVLAYDVAA